MNVRLWDVIRASVPAWVRGAQNFDVKRFVKGGALRRALLLAALCAGLGWIVGDLMRGSRAERAYSRSVIDTIGDHSESGSKGKLVGGGTYIAGHGAGDEELVAENVPNAIRKARAQGAKARENAVRETILNEKLGKYAKDHGWAQGGPYFPLGADLLKVKPRARPQLATASTYEMAPEFAALPLSVPDPVGGRSLFGPGVPGALPSPVFTESSSFLPAPQVPEPASWALLVLGFWALALRIRRRRGTMAAVRADTIQ
jgi:hypothetical protein